jgi:general secretion pathway protein G
MERTKFTEQKGLTLPEVLIVMIIIGILASIMIPALLMNYYKAKDKRVVAEMRNVAIAIGLYRVDYEFIPQSANYEELAVLLNSDIGGIAPIPEHDAWKHSLYYKAMGPSDYTLMSYGKDGLPGVPANHDMFDPDADIIIINGEFVATNR